MNNIIEIKGLSKKYKNGFQFGKVDLNVQAGRILGVIGEDGAGKTTLFKCLLNILHKDSGTVNIFGKDALEYDSEVKEDIGVVMDDVFVPDALNPKEVDSMMGSLYRNWDSRVYFDYLNKFNIPLDKKILTLSAGSLKKFQIATALSHHPKILLLDEPTNGLDPIVKNEVLRIFSDFINKDKDNTIIVSSNITSELESLCDDIVLIDKGSIVLNGEMDDILENYGIVSFDEKDFDKVDKKDYLTYMVDNGKYHVLVANKKDFKKKYKKNNIVDVNLEELMILMVKGVK